MGPQIAWEIVTIIFAAIFGSTIVIGLMGVAVNWEDGRSGTSPRWAIAAAMAAPLLAASIFFAVHAVWTVDRLTCAREGRNFQTEHRWDRVIGCYLKDSSGRFIPDDSYLTTRNEGK